MIRAHIIRVYEEDEESVESIDSMESIQESQEERESKDNNYNYSDTNNYNSDSEEENDDYDDDDSIPRLQDRDAEDSSDDEEDADDENVQIRNISAIATGNNIIAHHIRVGRRKKEFEDEDSDSDNDSYGAVERRQQEYREYFEPAIPELICRKDNDDSSDDEDDDDNSVECLVNGSTSCIDYGVSVNTKRHKNTLLLPDKEISINNNKIEENVSGKKADIPNIPILRLRGGTENGIISTKSYVEDEDLYFHYSDDDNRDSDDKIREEQETIGIEEALESFKLNQLDEDEALPIGGLMERSKLPGMIRISGFNPNGIKANQLERQLQHSKDFDIDIQCYSEINVNVLRTDQRQKFYEGCKKMDKSSRSVWGTS
jgi:hypothetical protein